MNLTDILHTRTKWLALAPLVLSSYFSGAQTHESKDTAWATGTIEVINAKTSQEAPNVNIQAKATEMKHIISDSVYQGVTNSQGEMDFKWITALDTHSVSVYTPQKMNVFLGPNPGRDRTLRVEDWGNYQVNVFNLQGKEVFTQEFQGDHTHFSLDNLVEGTYFMQVLDQKTHQTILTAKQLVSGESVGEIPPPQEFVNKVTQKQTAPTQQDQRQPTKLKKAQHDATYELTLQGKGFKTTTATVEVDSGINSIKQVMINPYDTLFFSGRIRAGLAGSIKARRLLTPIEMDDIVPDTTYAFDENFVNKVKVPVLIDTAGNTPSNATAKYQLQLFPKALSRDTIENKYHYYNSIDTIIDLKSGDYSATDFNIKEYTHPMYGKKRVTGKIQLLQDGSDTSVVRPASGALVVLTEEGNNIIDSVYTNAQGEYLFNKLYADGAKIRLGAGGISGRKGWKNIPITVEGSSFKDIDQGDTNEVMNLQLVADTMFTNVDNTWHYISAEEIARFRARTCIPCALYDTLSVHIKESDFAGNLVDSMKSYLDYLSSVLPITIYNDPNAMTSKIQTYNTNSARKTSVNIEQGSNSAKYKYGGTFTRYENDITIQFTGVVGADPLLVSGLKDEFMKEVMRMLGVQDELKRTSIMNANPSTFTPLDGIGATINLLLNKQYVNGKDTYLNKTLQNIPSSEGATFYITEGTNVIPQ